MTTFMGLNMTITKNQLKDLSSLLNKKFRKEKRQFILEGKRLVEQGLSSKYLCEKIIVTEEFQSQNESFIRLVKISGKQVEIVKSSEFKKISDTKSPQGIAALVKIPENSSINFKEELVVCLENVSDPGNLGAILRNCDWFGIKTVILSEDSADVYNSKVLRSSMGAVLNLNIVVAANFVDTLGELSNNGYNILTADMKGENVFEYSLKGKNAVVLCNEANGPSEDLQKICDERINIPKLGHVESLNVACASSVILAEFTKNLRIH